MTDTIVTETPVVPVPDGNKSTESSEIPAGAAPVRLPVMVVEGMETADGRYIEVGALEARTMPIALYSQVRSSHGSLDGDTATVLTGAITKATRRPGPEVTQLSTGQPFPDGTFVWEGEGWMYQDVPAPPEKSAYTLVKDKALRGNSVDLSEVDAEFVYEDGQDLADDPSPRRIVITQGVIGATTLVGQPAFPDAYIELDGMPFAVEGETLESVTAGGVPMWRSVETGDVCGPCSAVDGPHDTAITAALGIEDGETHAALLDGLLGDNIDPGDITPRHTGGMLALVPANPNMLLVPGGDPASELHLTLAYLGDDVTGWPVEDVAAVHRIALEATDFDARLGRVRAEAEARGDDPAQAAKIERDAYGRTRAQSGPLDASIFSHAVFNPNGDNGHDPATVYLLDGSGDRGAIEQLASEVTYEVRDAIGSTQFPDQHAPYVPHVTAGYGVPIDQLTYSGPVQFDRLRVALGDTVTDYPLGGGGAILASAVPTPPAAIFADPRLNGPTPATVGEMTEWGAPVFGHLACWGTCHIGFSGKCVTPPRSASGYAYFMVHSTQAFTEAGAIDEIPVGYGTVGTGHADVRRNAMAAAEHYDNTGTVAFEYAVGEDAHGIWFAGRMLPGLGEEMEHKARGTVFSGDWRTIRGNLELVASLGVNVPGFPVPRVRVASGQPVALVAAGVPQAPAQAVDTLAAAGVVKPSDMREILGYVRGHAIRQVLGEIEELTAGVPQELEDAMAGHMAVIFPPVQ